MLAYICTMPKKQPSKSARKRKKPDLPDKLIFKKKQGTGGKKEKAREDFFKNLPEEEMNPNGKEDFEKALRGILGLPEDEKE